MLKIATHNSGTGEKGSGLLSWLVTPFACCQSKTIKEQYNAGCRMFDFKVRRNDKKVWVFAHGLWTSRKRLSKVLDWLDKKAEEGELIYVSICYEGEYDGKAFAKVVDRWVKTYNNIRWTYAAVKKPEWDVVKIYNGVCVEECFENFETSAFSWVLPIPCLWKKKVKFCECDFKMVDFL